MNNRLFVMIKTKIVPILKKKGVKRAGIFGSFARGEQKKNSDVDILIKLPLSYGLLEMASLRRELRELLKREVDLVEYGWIHPKIKKQALKEEIRII